MNPALHSSSAAKLQQLVSLLPVPAFLTRDNRISFVNQAAQRLFNASDQALRGHSPLEFLDPWALSPAPHPLHGQPESAPANGHRNEVVLSAEGNVRLVQTSATQLGDQDANTVLVMMHDVTDLRRSQAKLAQSQTEMRRLAAHVDRLADDERSRLAGELHDDLRQTLAAIRLELGALSAQLAEQDTPAVARLEYVSLLALNAMESAGRMVNDLRPPILGELGLAAALEAMVAQVAQRSGLRCRFSARVDAQAAVLGRPMVASTLFRAAREMLDTAVRLPGVDSAQVWLLGAHGGRVQLRVSHSGATATALQSPEWKTHVAALQQRLLLVGGEIRHSQAGATHTLDATIPVTPQPGSAATDRASVAPGDDVYAMLLRFLYRAPVGLVQTALDGQIEMLNPRAAQLLMPFASDGQLTNLLGLFANAAPQLAGLVAGMKLPSGLVCDALPITQAPSEPGAAPHGLTLSLLKQDGLRLMAVLS